MHTLEEGDTLEEGMNPGVLPPPSALLVSHIALLQISPLVELSILEKRPATQQTLVSGSGAGGGGSHDGSETR